MFLIFEIFVENLSDFNKRLTNIIKFAPYFYLLFITNTDTPKIRVCDSLFLFWILTHDNFFHI